ncbi:MAG TPA: TetR family transcriptional regulator [Steroidobacteraceae bacterium]|nr:TetR family transcriptional regulator [Steroidobacteraceae bacterium]
MATATREMTVAGRRPRQAKRSGRRAGRIPRAAVEPDFSARERLLDTAGRLMSDRHSIDVSLSEIAGHSGLNSALVKYYFGNKNGLLLALVEREAAAALQGFEELLRQDLSPTEKLRRHIAGIINNFFRTPYLNRLLHSLLDDRHARSAKQVNRIFVQPLMELQRELLAAGMRAGEFKPVDPLLFYVSVLGACDHLFNARYAVRSLAGVAGMDDELRERYVAHVCDVFIHGLRNLPPSRAGRRAVRRSGR